MSRLTPAHHGATPASSPENFFLVGMTYFHGASALHSQANATLMLPATQLLMAFSVELCLKAFLAHRGVNLKYLKSKVGHDLVLAYNLARDNGMSELDGSLCALCIDLSRSHKEAWFRYLPDVDEIEVINPSQALPLIRVHLDYIGRLIGETQTIAQIKW